MTEKTDPVFSGEEREKRRRRSFWWYLGIAMVVSAFAGLFSGYVSGGYLEGNFPLWVPLAGAAIVAAGFTWFSFDYYRRVDELDLMDNLWANLIGVHIGTVIVGVWWFLSDIEQVRAPGGMEALLVVLAAILITYSLRKLNFR